MRLQHSVFFTLQNYANSSYFRSLHRKIAASTNYNFGTFAQPYTTRISSLRAKKTLLLTLKIWLKRLGRIYL